MTREEAMQKWVIPAIERVWNDKKCKEIIKALEPKTGHWIMTDDVDVYYDLPSYKCSKCGQTSLEDGDYCSNCGCRMVYVERRDKE